ncbi:MAG: phosphotransferase family protein [Anaerolineae bacterium]|nr:phosphotransferase family protein [Anaerolineae bacterium]
MTTEDTNAPFEQLGQRIAPGSRLLRAWPLTGGVSAQMTALEVARTDGTTVKWVARSNNDVDAHGEYVVAGEFRLLRALQATALPVPTPIAYHPPGKIFDTPVLVLAYVEGAPQFAPADVGAFVRQLAAQLAQIHGLDVAALDLSFLPRQSGVVHTRLRARPAALDEAMSEGRIRDTLAAVWPLPPINPSALLHGDFWPGNVLCQEDQIAAVIDWEDAALGDPLADLANGRLEMLWAFGDEVMHSFTRAYAALMPGIDLRNLPYWDLSAALRPIGQFETWGLDAATVRTMRERHRGFVAQAFTTLSG